MGPNNLHFPNEILDCTSDADLATTFGNHCTGRIRDIRPMVLNFAYVRITWGVLYNPAVRTSRTHWCWGVTGRRDLDSKGAEHWFKAHLENVMNR